VSMRLAVVVFRTVLRKQLQLWVSVHCNYLNSLDNIHHNKWSVAHLDKKKINHYLSREPKASLIRDFSYFKPILQSRILLLCGPF
jgi:hypothetical protein